MPSSRPAVHKTQGVLEVLLIDANGINGSLPACLFNDNSTLYQFSATDNVLAGSIPDAFAGADRLQSFAAAGVSGGFWSRACLCCLAWHCGSQGAGATRRVPSDSLCWTC